MKTVPHIHIAPHTLEMASMWAILTRLEEPKKANLTSMQKLKLYNGKSIPGYTEDNVKELRKETIREGMDGISPRYIQDKISNALVIDKGNGCLNPFIVLNELESGLKAHSLIKDEDVKKHYKELTALLSKSMKISLSMMYKEQYQLMKQQLTNYVETILIMSKPLLKKKKLKILSQVKPKSLMKD